MVQLLGDSLKKKRKRKENLSDKGITYALFVFTVYML